MTQMLGQKKKDATIYSIVLSFFTNAYAQSYKSCLARCLGIDSYHSRIYFFGDVSGFGGSSLSAWRVMNGKCNLKVRSYGLAPVLADGIFSLESYRERSHESWSSYDYRSTRWFGYSEVSESSSQYSIYRDVTGRSLKLEFAHPTRSCWQEEGDIHEVDEYYEGDLPVLG